MEATDKPMCAKRVRSIARVAERFPCARVATTMIDGEWYCTQHAKIALRRKTKVSA